jgi:uncharacterized protein YaiL (DUF2058 family)
MAIYNNDKDPNVTQWEHEEKAKVNPSYREWWEQNKERILEEDKLNHDMQFKAAYTKQGDY